MTVEQTDEATGTFSNREDVGRPGQLRGKQKACGRGHDQLVIAGERRRRTSSSSTRVREVGQGVTKK